MKAPPELSPGGPLSGGNAHLPQPEPVEGALPAQHPTPRGPPHTPGPTPHTRAHPTHRGPPHTPGPTPHTRAPGTCGQATLIHPQSQPTSCSLGGAQGALGNAAVPGGARKRCQLATVQAHSRKLGAERRQGRRGHSPQGAAGAPARREPSWARGSRMLISPFCRKASP